MARERSRRSLLEEHTPYAVRRRLRQRPASALETLLVGGLAATLAYAAGALLQGVA